MDRALKRNPLMFDHPTFVIPGLDPGISGARGEMAGSSPAQWTWVAGSSPAMTNRASDSARSDTALIPWKVTHRQSTTSIRFNPEASFFW